MFCKYIFSCHKIDYDFDLSARNIFLDCVENFFGMILTTQTEGETSGNGNHGYERAEQI